VEDRYSSVEEYLTAKESLAVEWFLRNEVIGVEVGISEIWELAQAITTGIVVEQEGEIWTVVMAVADLPVDFRTEITEWEKVSEVTVLLLEPTTELVTWTLVDTVTAEVDVSDEVPPEPPPEKVNWWIWGGLAVIAIVVAIIIARRRG